MKPIIFSICLLLGSFGFTASAQKATPETKVIQLKEIFTSVSADDDIDIVLTDSKSGDLLVEGNTKALDVQLRDGHLQLAKSHHTTNPVKVYVPAAYVSKIYMNGNGMLSSSSVLSGNRIKVVLAGESRIALRSTGNVTVETMNDIQFVRNR